jgi:DNA-binding Xre family transcriptional regulator
MANKQPPTKIKILVPELMKARNVPVWDLVREAGLAPGTAYKLASSDKAAQVTEISFYVLERLCKYFNVPLSEIIQYDPNSVDSG